MEFFYLSFSPTWKKSDASFISPLSHKRYRGCNQNPTRHKSLADWHKPVINASLSKELCFQERVRNPSTFLLPGSCWLGDINVFIIFVIGWELKKWFNFSHKQIWWNLPFIIQISGACFIPVSCFCGVRVRLRCLSVQLIISLAQHFVRNWRAAKRDKTMKWFSLL